MSIALGIVIIYAVVFGTVYSSTCEPFQLSKNNTNKALIGHSVLEISGENLHDCARNCMSLLICKSFDYDNAEYMCKLNDVDKASVDSLEFQTKKGSFFSDISEWPSEMVGSCGSRPCPDSQRCNVNGGSYVCRDVDFLCANDKKIVNGKILIDAPGRNKVLDEASVICDNGYFTCQHKVKCQALGQWETASCTSLTSVCSSVVVQMTKLSCSQSQIQIFTTPISQPDAGAACKKQGGELAKVDKEWKFDAIETLLRDCPVLTTGQYWVDGYTQRNKIDDWKFSDGTLVPMSKHFWKDNAPNAQEGVPTCFRMVNRNYYENGDYRFDDYECQYKVGYICELN